MMSVDAERIADEILQTPQEQPTVDAEGIADSLLSGQQAAASELLQADFEPGAYAGPGLRWSLARGDNLKEKQLRLQKQFPRGELKVLPESIVLGFDDDTLIWRETPENQWKMIEPQGFDWFDIPEAIAPSAESIVAETAVAIGTSGGSVPVTVGRQILGAIAGEAIEQLGQSISGTQAQAPMGVAGEIGAEGLWSGVGGFAVSPVVGSINIARGRGAMRVGDEGLEIMRAAKELSPELGEKLTPALVTDNPAVRLSERQSSALLPGLNRRYRELIALMDTAVKSSAPGNAANAMQETVKGLDDFSDYFVRRLILRGNTASQGGRALQEGVEQFSETSRQIVSGLYDQARRIQEPVFDLAPATKIAQDLRAGSKGIIDPRVEKQIQYLEAIDGPVSLSDGSLLSVTNQIRNVRTQLYAMKHVEPGKVADQTTAQASDLYRSLNDVLDNPSNTSEAFRVAWKSANNAAKKRFTTLEKAPVIAAAKTQNPADLVKTYVRAGQVDNLLALRDTVSAKKWNTFVDAAYGDLLTDPKQLSKRLASFDQETLDVLMPRTDQALWKNVAKELDRITSVSADDIAERQVSNRNFIDSLINTANPREYQTLMRAINNTNRKGMRDSLRSAIVEWAWDGVVEKGKAGLSVNSNVLAKRVTSLKRKGLWGLLSSEERRIIGNAKIVSKAFQNVQDAGTSIQAAEAVSGLKRMHSGAVMTFLRSGLLAQFYMSSMGKRLLIGSGLPNSNGRFLRLMGGVLAQTAPPEDLEELREE